MENILKYIPGFRSGNKRNMKIASAFYAFIILMSFLVGSDFFFLIGGLALLTISIIDLVKNKKQKLSIKSPIISLVLAMVLISVGTTIDSPEKRTAGTSETNGQIEAENEKEDEAQTINEYDTNITGDLDIKFKDNKAIVTIITNAVDGTIFETALMDGNLNMVSDYITVEGGKAIKEFDVNKDWETGYISGIAMMRFNLDDHPQPKEVKEAYGENGEKLKGDLIEENNLGGYNINFNSKTVAYPDENAVKEKQDELFFTALNELIDSSDGVIINVQPHFTKDDWSSVAVTISDSWYNSQEHEKERFAETIGDTVEKVVKNTEKVSGDKNITVYFYDTYQKELASPKIMGGYKIKR